ncbi:MAG: hypothetical protein EXR01_04510 [Acetobacteraceae bacterium]|nr:hypothetical protein [Acetobacteraceae bacterium]
MSALLYTLAWAGTLLDQLGGLRLAGNAAGLCLLSFLLIEFPHQRRYAQILLLALLGIGLLGITHASDPVALFLNSWRRGAAFAAFFFALGMLRDAAATSPLVRRCGQQLVAQPAGRRYAALTGGAHVFGIILSYGAIDLLAAMVTRANQQGPTALRRMLLAIYRGFCVMNCWAPLNLMTVVVSAAVPGAPMRILLPIAFIVAQLLLALGWLEDFLRAPRRSGNDARPGTWKSWSIHLGIVAIVLLVMVLAEATAMLFDASLAAGVTLVLPPIGLGWITLQLLRFGGQRLPRFLARRLRKFAARIPSFRGEAAVLGASGFVGVALGGLLPSDGLAPILAPLPALLIPLLVPVVLIATGQIGLNPIAVIAVLGAAMPAPESLGVAPAVLAFACMLGWGLAVGMTPMSASAIATARWSGATPWTVSTRWNGAFTLAGLLLVWVAIAMLHALWP